jgi:ubiquinone/menaquinone biosynthesis C-methylase UbiE
MRNQSCPRRIVFLFCFLIVALSTTVDAMVTGAMNTGDDGRMTCRDKILNGILYSDEEWNDYLKTVHTGFSGVTRPLADFVTTRGLNTYHALLAAIPTSELSVRTVLDLGCGDGYFTKMLWSKMGERGNLTGLDLVPEEIAAARRYLSDDRVTWIASPAQKMPLETASQDTIVSHLVLMLSLPLEPVLDEIARVLKPGGTLYAVVTRPGLSDNPFQELSAFIDAFVQSKYPKYQGIRSGDPRTQSVDDLQTLFSNERGFRVPFQYSDYAMLVSETPENIWNKFFATLHRTLILSPELREQLREELTVKMQSMMDSQGKVMFGFPLRMIIVKKSARR